MVWALVLTVAVKMDDVWILRNQGVAFLSCLIAGFDLINTASSVSNNPARQREPRGSSKISVLPLKKKLSMCLK